MITLFWLSVTTIIWVYAGYPLVLWFVARYLRTKSVGRDDIKPWVTLIISAYNEEQVIRQKLKNSLALEYPHQLMDFVVVSDCSDDATDCIVAEFEPMGVRLMRMARRSGKTAGLNHAVTRAYGEIVIFSDANAMYHPKAVKHLVRNFADRTVGCVTGESRYNVEEGSGSSESENLYWRYELALKKLESQIGSLVGGDGAIYAIRKDLFQPMKPSDLSDFVNPLQITAQGYRNVYEPYAVSYEKAGDTFEKEFRRKVRIVNRAWRGLWQVRTVLNVFRYGFFSVQVISHKLLRWLVGLFMILALLANAFLLVDSLFYLATGLLQVLFYALAAIGWSLSKRASMPRLFYVPYYFCLINFAALRGVVDYFISENDYTTWQTVRNEGGS